VAPPHAAPLAAAAAPHGTSEGPREPGGGYKLGYKRCLADSIEVVLLGGLPRPPNAIGILDCDEDHVRCGTTIALCRCCVSDARRRSSLRFPGRLRGDRLAIRFHSATRVTFQHRQGPAPPCPWSSGPVQPVQ